MKTTFTLQKPLTGDFIFRIGGMVTYGDDPPEDVTLELDLQSIVQQLFIKARESRTKKSKVLGRAVKLALKSLVG